MDLNPALVESPRFTSLRAPLKSSQLSAQAYILSIANLHAHYATSSSAPSNIIDIFDKSTFQRVGTFTAHENATTSLYAVENVGGNLNKTLVSSGKDGYVKFWDTRSRSSSIECEE
jgi:WD40 repeat protein